MPTQGSGSAAARMRRRAPGHHRVWAPHPLGPRSCRSMTQRRSPAEDLLTASRSHRYRTRFTLPSCGVPDLIDCLSREGLFPPLGEGIPLSWLLTESGHVSPSPTDRPCSPGMASPGRAVRMQSQSGSVHGSASPVLHPTVTCRLGRARLHHRQCICPLCIAGVLHSAANWE